MRSVAPGVWRVPQLGGPTVNVYLAGDVLFDAGSRWDRRRILAATDGLDLSLLALTHVHPDHQGAARDVCETHGVEIACAAGDVDAMEGRAPFQPTRADHWLNRFSAWFAAGPPHPVGRVLAEGDEVAGFRVVPTPGHSPGHVAFLRESDRVVICGDTVRNMSYATGRPGVREPPEAFNADTGENRDSIRKLAALEPSLLLPGHGPAITDMAAFQRFAAELPG